MNKYSIENKFEQISNKQKAHAAEMVATTALQLGKVAIDFSRVDRIPRYPDGERENDVEHSYMLALVAPEIAYALELNLDYGLLSQYAIVHDIVELETGDVATFLATDALLTEKAQREHEAMTRLRTTLPSYTYHLLQQYESQDDPESRFVKLVDKLLPLITDIIGQGKRVMHEDYDVYTLAALQQCHEAVQRRWEERYGDEFPDVVLAHRILAELFETVYKTQDTI